MTYKFITAEKLSVARSIMGMIGATEKHDDYLEGNDYLVSWCIGRLAFFVDARRCGERLKKWRYEDLPIFPETWQYIVPDDKKQQFDVLCSLMRRPDMADLVCATDAGREGELVFRLVYQVAGCQKPFECLRISSTKDSAIRDGFAHLKSGGDYDPLYQSTLCRAKTDWLIGTNAIRLFSALYHKDLTVGRVQTPTLKMLADRNARITDFKKEKYYITHTAAGGTNAVSSRFPDAAEANTVRATCARAQAIHVSVTWKKKMEQPLELYDLIALQRKVNRLLGYIVKQTFDYAQTLYLKRLLTYPRMDSQYFTNDMLPAVGSPMSGLWKLVPFAEGLNPPSQFDRILSSRKVSDHHIIIPIAEFVKQGFGTLAESEEKLLSLICCKLLCAVAGPHICEAVTATSTCAGQGFTVKGRTVFSPGWKKIEHRFRSSLKTNTDEDAEVVRELLGLCEGQTFVDAAVSVTKHFTTSPRPHAEGTLLSAIERAGAEDTLENTECKGLSIPVTRAAILEELVQMGFVQRKGKQLTPIKDGTNLAVVLPKTLTSPQLTAEWENRLTKITKGQADPDESMDGIETQARELVQIHSCISEEKQELLQAERASTGTCPHCGEAVYEGKKSCCCGNRACQFVMWKNDRFLKERKKTFTPRIATALPETNKVRVKGFYPVKTDKTYNGMVLLADTGDKRVNYRIKHRSQRTAIQRAQGVWLRSR